MSMMAVSELDSSTLISESENEPDGGSEASESVGRIGEDPSRSLMPRRKRARSSRARPKGCTTSGRFRPSWTLPRHISSSSSSDKQVYCKLCCCDISVSHGGINDVKRHVDSLKHKAKLKQAEGSSLMNFLGEAHQPSISCYFG